MNYISFIKDQSGMKKKEIGLSHFVHSIQKIKTFNFHQLMQNKESSNQKRKEKLILLEAILKNIYKSSLENLEISEILIHINKEIQQMNKIA